jgi:hypothetical protein
MDLKKALHIDPCHFVVSYVSSLENTTSTMIMVSRMRMSY